MKNSFTVLFIVLFGFVESGFSQNVGIGTNAPGTKLEIKGNYGTDLFNVKSSTDSSRFYIKENGFVGIGIASPNARLQVLGDLMVGNGTNTYYSTPAGEGAITLNGSTPGAMFRLVANDGSGTFNQYQNAYYDGANWKYNYGAQATRFTSSAGTFGLYVAPSGTAGSNITWTPSIYINNSGQVGIGKTSAGSALDVKGTIRISGATSGYVGLAVPAAAGATTFTLPSADGTTGQVLKTDGSGNLSWGSVVTGSGSITGNITSLSGDYTVSDNDFCLFVTGGNNVTVTVPNPGSTTVGRIIIVKAFTNPAKTVTVTTPSGGNVFPKPNEQGDKNPLSSVRIGATHDGEGDADTVLRLINTGTYWVVF